MFEHREEIIETMRRILNESKTVSTSTINQASGYIALLTSKSFIFWLSLFYKIMPQVDILYAKFQTREIDPLIANKSISSFESQLLQIRNNIMKTPDTSDSELTTTKRRMIDGNEYTREAKEVCDIIICQAKDRFSFTGHLTATSLFYADKFNQYSLHFPENAFQEAIKSYPYFDERKFRSELSVIYETEDFKSLSGLLPLYDVISQNNELSATFSETLKLLKILITIPMTSAEPERCFSTLGRIKTFLRNSMGQERLSALAMLSQEKDFIQSIPDFNEKVIDKFAANEDRRMDFLFQ